MFCSLPMQRIEKVNCQQLSNFGPSHSFSELWPACNLLYTTSHFNFKTIEVLWSSSFSKDSNIVQCAAGFYLRLLSLSLSLYIFVFACLCILSSSFRKDSRSHIVHCCALPFLSAALLSATLFPNPHDRSHLKQFPTMPHFLHFSAEPFFLIVFSVGLS